jgi:hypothetical protein
MTPDIQTEEEPQPWDDEPEIDGDGRSDPPISRGSDVGFAGAIFFVAVALTVVATAQAVFWSVALELLTLVGMWLMVAAVVRIAEVNS